MCSSDLAEVEVGAWRGAHEDASLAARGSIIREVGVVKLAVLADARLVTGEAPFDALPSLGDDHLMPGLRGGQMRGRARLVAGLDAAHPLLGGGWLRLRLRGGGVREDREPGPARRWVSGLAVDGVWNTPFGPIAVGYGMNTSGRCRTEVELGMTF